MLVKRYIVPAAITLLAACATALPACSDDDAVVTPGTGASCDGERWLGAWTANPADADPERTLAGETLRMLVTPSFSGDEARVTVSNEFGSAPLIIDRAFLGMPLANAGPALRQGSSVELSFDGEAALTIAPGESAVTDGARFAVRADDPIAISVDVADDSTTPASRHVVGLQTSFIAPGGGAADVEARSPFTVATSTRYLATALDVRAPADAGRVIAFGDSLTDGQQGSPTAAPGAVQRGIDRDARYPDFLARRIAAEPGRQTLSVTNSGIAGNSLAYTFYSYYGPPGLDRLAGDVIEQPGVTDVIVLEGINDLNVVGPKQVIDSLRETVQRLRQADLNVLLSTLAPGGNSVANRRQINRWIRAQGIADGVVDFERALRDPDEPGRYLPRYDSGGGIHPNAAGYRAMARAVDLAKLRGTGCAVD